MLRCGESEGPKGAAVVEPDNLLEGCRRPALLEGKMAEREDLDIIASTTPVPVRWGFMENDSEELIRSRFNRAGGHAANSVLLDLLLEIRRELRQLTEKITSVTDPKS